MNPRKAPPLKSAKSISGRTRPASRARRPAWRHCRRRAPRRGRGNPQPACRVRPAPADRRTRSCVPVATANTVSPSCGVCTGRIERASPSCAIIARRLAEALSSRALVATTAMVVLARGSLRAASAGSWREVGAVVRSPTSDRPCGGGGRPPNSLVLLQRPGPELRHVAHGRVAARIHRHQRADLQAGRGIDRRGAAQPALEVAGLGAEAGAGIAQREVAAGLAGRRIGQLAIGRPVPVLVAAVQQVEQDGASARSARRRRRRRRRGRARAASASRRRPTTGRRPSRPRDRSHRRARRGRTGSSRSVSRVPGAPPRTSTEATDGRSHSTTLTPERRRWSSALPTRMPSTSVMRLRGPGFNMVAEHDQSSCSVSALR